MIKSKIKEVIKEEEVDIAIVCDICGKEIANEEELNSKMRKGGYYYSVTTSHRDWGNDSWESRKSKEYCSKECMLIALNEYLKDSSETLQFEFERERL